MEINLLIKNASSDNFGKYGRVVKLPSGVPTSQSSDYKFWSDIVSYNIEGDTEIGICIVYKHQKNIICVVERHLRTPELLIPIDAAFILPIFAEDNDQLEVFKVNTGEAIVINSGIWHGACIPVGRSESSYFVIFRKDTPVEDVEKKEIAPVEIEVE